MQVKKCVLHTLPAHDHVNYYKDGAWHVGPSYPLNSRDLFAFAVSAFEFLACGGEVQVKE